VAGLRERKKQATRDALSWAALRLVVQRGLDAVLVEDIAEAAGVSPRTFNNYFTGKAEAIAYRHRDRYVQLVDELRERPAEEPLWDALTAAMTGVFGLDQPDAPEGWTAGVRVMVSHPALVAEFIKANVDGEQLLAVAVAERVGPVDGMYPKLVAAAVGSAVRIAMAEWMSSDHPEPIGRTVLAAMRRFAAGLAEPS
jgi:AcrR family transcriptional regulator